MNLQDTGTGADTRRTSIHRQKRRIYLLVRRLIELGVGVPVLLSVGTCCRMFNCKTRAHEFFRCASKVWTGELAIVGPTERVDFASGATLPKGILAEADLARRAGLDTDLASIDAEYAQRFGPLRDIGILLRSIWTRLIWKSTKTPPGNHFNLLGVVVNNSTVPLILETIREMLQTHPNTRLQQQGANADEEHRTPPAHVCFVNANNFNLHLQQSEYRAALRESELVLPDGIGVSIALRMAGGQLQRNLNGTDLFPPLADLLKRDKIPIFVLGAEENVLAKAVAKIQHLYPGLLVAGSHSGYFTTEQELEVCDAINSSGALVAILGMGTPRQELFFRRNARHLRVSVVFSMGGILDFLGEKNKRAPGWMRHSGLEWAYRLLQEPGRMWRRYVIGNPVFLYRAWLWTRVQRGQK